MNVEIAATCTCNSVKFKSSSEPILQLTCHCGDCRAATGNDFSNIVFFKLSAIEMSGAMKTVGFVSYLGNDTERLACTKCGDVMFDKSSGFKYMLGVIAERIIPPFDIIPEVHVWTQSKLDHIEISNEIRSFAKGIVT